MNANKLNAWLGLIANFGVVIGLALLVFEINQNTRMMQAQINQNRTDTAMSEQQAVFNSDYVPTLDVKIKNGERLTEEEMIRFEHMFRSFNRNMDNQLWQYNHGFLGENIPYSIIRAVRIEIAGHDLGIATWDNTKQVYTEEYVAFVDDAIADLRH